MQEVEALFFGEGENSGEAKFQAFASQYAHLFEDGCDPELMENKLE